jgi:uncharacterized protein YjiS (DUF1127 family)
MLQPDPHQPAHDAFHKVLAAPDSAQLDQLLRSLEQLQPLPNRINSDPQNVERGLAKLVLTLIELLRQLMERQALRRMEGNTLTDAEIEQLGQTFMRLQKRMEEMKEAFGLSGEDLNLDLGPLGKLL